MIKYFKKIFIQDRVISQFQDNTAEITNQILKNPLLDYVILKDVLLSTSPTKVNHLLGRDPIGWFLITKNSLQDVGEVSRTNQYLELDASGSVTVDIYVF